MHKEERPGYVKLWRNINHWRWFRDSNTKAVFLELICRANYKDTVLDGEVLQRGQCVMGYRELAKALGLSLQNVRTSIDRLKSTLDITLNSTRKGTIVTICKYNEYQCNPDNGQHTEQHSGQQTGNTRVTPPKNTKKERKKELDIPVDLNEVKKRYPTDDSEVLLSDKDISKLEVLMPITEIGYWVECLNGYAMGNPQKFRRYKDHFKVILNWRTKQRLRPQQGQNHERVY